MLEGFLIMHLTSKGVLQIMSAFWQELIINLGGNAVLGGLIIYIGKFYLEKVGRNEQAAIDERLKTLEQHHEKLSAKNEHFHQISQESYQKLFDRKIKVYDSLSVLSLKFNSYSLTSKEAIKNSDIKEQVKNELLKVHYKCVYEKYITIAETIEKNSSVISKELLGDYIEWKKHLSNNIGFLHLSLQELYARKVNIAYQVTDNLETSIQSEQFLEQISSAGELLNNLHISAIGEIVEGNLSHFQIILNRIIEDSSKINAKINDLN